MVRDRLLGTGSIAVEVPFCTACAGAVDPALHDGCPPRLTCWPVGVSQAGGIVTAMAFERITVDPERMRGLPCIRDTRVTVSAVLGQLAAGQTIDDIVRDYPYLERDDVLAALAYAAAVTRDREVPLTAAG